MLHALPFILVRPIRVDLITAHTFSLEIFLLLLLFPIVLLRILRPIHMLLGNFDKLFMLGDNCQPPADFAIDHGELPHVV